MTQTSPSKMNKFDYQFLTGTWDGVAGAAYNQTYEFCKEFGWCDRTGKPTDAGLRAIQLYEMEASADD
jgi:hypothetical protein